MDNRGDTALDDLEFWKKIGYSITTHCNKLTKNNLFIITVIV